MAEEKKEVPPLPWPYEELDVEYVRKLGHLGCYVYHCAGGAFWGIMEALREKVGYPYTLLPMPTKEEVLAAIESGEKLPPAPMTYGAAGVAGWATICGAPNGAISAFNMVSKNYMKLGQALLRWYEITPFPSDKSNEYASRHEFFVKKLKSDKVLPQSVSHSVLCHVSVGKWCEVSGYASGSAERAERCCRLVGDVAAKAAELLLTVKPIDAQEAYRIGLVNKVVPPEQLMPAAKEWAENICQAAPLAVRAAKEAMIRGYSMPLEEGLRLESALIAYTFSTEDFTEGATAFAEKRKPDYKAK